MARGTADEVIKESGLVSCHRHRAGADRLAPRLRDAPGVTAAAAFGATLHVSGPERGPLLAAIKPLRTQGIDWKEAAPTLEDVFIHLMGKAQRQRAGRVMARAAGFLAPTARHRRQGGPAAPPRPADLRHDVRRADHAAAAVRLRHRHRSASSAGRGDLGRRHGDHPHDRLRARQHRLHGLHPSAGVGGRGRTPCCSGARSSSS